MAFGLQDLSDFGGDGSAPDSSGNSGIVSALENIGVNFAGAAATVGLQSFANSQGVRSNLVNQYAYTGGIARPPGTLVAAPASSNTLVVAGVLLFGGLLLYAAFRRKG